jgi:hypothetical protein
MTLLYVIMMVLQGMFGGSQTGKAYHLNQAQYKTFQSSVSSYGLGGAEGYTTSNNGNGAIIVINDQNEF